MMKTVNISLPAQQLDLIQRQVDLGLFASVSEAVRDAIRNTFMKEALTANGLTARAENSLVKRLSTKKGYQKVKFTKGTPLRQKVALMTEADDRS